MGYIIREMRVALYDKNNQYICDADHHQFCDDDYDSIDEFIMDKDNNLIWREGLFLDSFKDRYDSYLSEDEREVEEYEEYEEAEEDWDKLLKFFKIE